MSRTFACSLLLASLAFTVTVLAEKPPKDFQDLMKSNGSIIDISLGMIRNTTVRPETGEVEGTSLRAHIRTKDYDGIGQDAARLKANFAKIEIFWTQRKLEDAITFSKAAVKAATDLEAAAKAKDDAAISVSTNAVAATCRGCHQAHRAQNAVDGTFDII